VSRQSVVSASIVVSQQEMEVVRYQGIGVQRERVALAHGPKGFDEGLIVALPEKDILPVIATSHT
jgi:hypothetical protein